MKRFVLVALAATLTAEAIAQIYTNGVFSTGPTSASGVAAPAGTTWSEVSDGNTSAGATVTVSGVTGAFHLSDDFTVPVGQIWNLTSVVARAYQTGSTPALSPFSAGRLQIWNGPPNAGGSIIFGDLTTNVMTSSVFSTNYRIFSSVNTMGGTPSVPGTTRPIYNNTLGAVISLGAGTYWIDYQMVTTNAAVAFAPGVIPSGTPPGRTDAGFNALQFQTTAAWFSILDTGNPAALPDVAIDQQWYINGNVTVEHTGVTLGPGATTSGTDANLLISDDLRWNIRPGAILVATQDPISVTLTGTAPPVSPLSIDVVVESSATVTGIRQIVEAWNFSGAGSWTNLETFVGLPTGANPDRVTTLSVPTPADHKGPGNEMRVRLRYKNTTAVLVYPWNVRLDRMYWLYVPN